MRKIFAALLLFACSVGNTWATYNWAGFTAPPRTTPFTEGGVTYTSFVQTRHPYYNYNQIVYYPAGISDSLKPVGADYNQGAPYQHLRILLNPASQSQAWDSEDYNPNVLVFYCYGNHDGSGCRDNTWLSNNSTQIRNAQYTWFDWNYSGPTGYNLQSDLVRAVGINIKVNFGYAWGGQFGLSTLSANDVLITGSPLFQWPLNGTFASRTVNLAFGATWIHGECPSGTYKKHGGIDVNATNGEDVFAAHAGTVKAVYYDATWQYAVVIEDTTGQYTSVYWHVTPHNNLAPTHTVTKGQKIATIANLGGNTHFHFGVRSGAYNSSLSLAGALPVTSCGSYPAYPENLMDPSGMSY